METQPHNYPRLIAVAALALIVLIAMVAATGGGFPKPAAAPTVAPLPTPTTPANSVRGLITTSTTHISGHTWRYTYTIRNTGKVPIAGFQINGDRANLFHIRTIPGWSFFGAGVCGQSHPHILVYWSVDSASTLVIPAKGQGTVGFDVNTDGSVPLSYSLSWGNAAPAFGTLSGPAASSLPASAPCGH